MKWLKLSWPVALMVTAPALVFLGIDMRSYRADKLRPTLEKIAGANTVDCSFASTTPYSVRLRQMTNCNALNWKSKRAFFCCDEVAQDGFAMSSSGQLYELKQTQSSWFKPPTVKVLKCEGVRIVKFGGNPYFWSKKRTLVPDVL